MHIRRSTILIAIVLLSGLTPPSTFAQSPTATATLKLDPYEGEFIAGETITTAVRLDTHGNETDQVDVVLQYDTTLLEVVDADENEDGVQIEEGDVYEITLTNDVNTDDGIIAFTQTSLTPDTFYTTENGEPGATVARITFMTLASGTADVSFVTDDTATTSQVLSIEDNILSDTEDAEFIVTEEQNNSTSTVASIVMNSNVTSLPADGVQEAQITVTAFDADGAVVPDAPITATVVIGDAQLEALSDTTNEGGQVTLVLTASETAGPQLIEASVEDDPFVTASLEITLEETVSSAETPEEPEVDMEEEVEAPLLQSAPERLTNSGPAIGWNALIACIAVLCLGSLAHVRHTRVEKS